MSVYKKDNSFKSYVLVLIGFFILILFTKDQIFSIQENMDTNTQLDMELTEKRGEIEKLNSLKETLKNNTGTLTNISKYQLDFKEDEIIDYIYSEVKKSNYDNGVVIIKNISFSKGIVNEFGFKESDINISIKVSNEARMKEFLDFLVSDDSKYKFYISNFNYPYGKSESVISVNIPLKLFYK